MKVLLISKDARVGGAAVAARRLMQSLRDHQVEAGLLVQENGDHGQGIFQTSDGTLKRLTNRARFIYERVTFLPHEKDSSVRFMFSPANTGENLTRNRLVREADVIHLHWINGGFLSLRSLAQLLDSGKPLVWTFHDMWAFTGGCHISMECNRYREKCGNCPYVRRPGERDLSSRIWKRKSEIFGNRSFSIVTPSRWLKECAAESSLLGHCDIRAIPNPIDPDLFQPVDRDMACRNLGLDPAKRYLLFGAANIRNMIKGFGYFVEAVHILHEELQGDASVEILLLGRTRGDEPDMLPFKTRCVSISGSPQRVAELFSLAHLLAVSSLQENFPNTIVESMLCGTPAVGFKTGGIPEMIDHKKDGYLSEHKSARDLARGMKWLLTTPDYSSVSGLARKSALERFSRERSVKEYMEVYRHLLAQNRPT